MSNLEPRIEAVRAKYDLSVDDFWQIKQNKQWVCKHAALEIVAVKAKIEWLPPQIIEANAPALVTSMIVTGKMGDRVEWATGETNQTNYSVSGKQPAYPWAMSEKRAKDRVVLKLVGIHGLVYSEDEMPSVSDEPVRIANSSQKPPKNEEARKAYKALQDELRQQKSVDDLKRWAKDPDVQALVEKTPQDWKDELNDEWLKMKKGFENAPKNTGDAVKDIVDNFGGRVVNDRFVDDFVNGHSKGPDEDR